MTGRPDRVHLGEELHGRKLLSVLRGYGRITDGRVEIVDVTGPQHSQIFHALTTLIGLGGTHIQRAGEGPNAKAAKASAVDAALAALARAEPALNLQMPDAAERRAARRRRKQARTEDGVAL